MKKLLALVLALVMVLSVTSVASAKGIALEKHPYEKPNRELPYYHYQTVPKSITTPTIKVTTDWDANGVWTDEKDPRGTLTVAFDTSKDAVVADIIKNMKVKSLTTGDVVADDVSWAYNTKTGKLELTVKNLKFYDNFKNFYLESWGQNKYIDKNGVLQNDGVTNYRVDFEWDPKTDTAKVTGTNITSTIYTYGTDGIKAETTEYYANGNPMTVTVKHIDADKYDGIKDGTVVGDKDDHDYMADTKEDHTDHRYAEVTFHYTEKGKLDYYEYKTEIDSSNVEPTTPNEFIVTATGDVMNATVNVKGIEYKYYTKEYWTTVGGLRPEQVTPNLLGWFIDNGVDTLGVAVAAPEGYENGFANTVHLFATRHWYPKNTVGVVGLSLRDEYPGLTDKWINIVPVDLTVQGTQEIELVAGNMFHIGKAFVDVDGDNVTVTYSYTSNVTEAFSECVKWFKNVDEITTEFCENPTSEMVFGQPVSIANDLGGQEVALLYICNSATYYQTFITKQDAPTRYYENLKKWQNYRAGLYELLEKIPE